MGKLEDGMADGRILLPRKHAVLLALTIQGSALLITLRYASSTSNGTFSHPTLVFLGQGINLVLSLAAILHTDLSLHPPSPSSTCTDAESGSCSRPSSPLLIPWHVPTPVQSLYRAVFSREAWLLAIPALLYTVQDITNLRLLAPGGPYVLRFHVLYQTRILATAFFSAWLLRRSLNVRSWSALIFLTIGASAVWLGSNSGGIAVPHPVGFHGDDAAFARSFHELGNADPYAAPVPAIYRRSASYEGIDQDQAGQSADHLSRVSLLTALTVALVSGLAGVVCERLLKGSVTSYQHSHRPSLVTFWSKNAQLALFSVAVSGLGVAVFDHERLIGGRLLEGFGPSTWLAVVFQGSNVILTSMCISFADSIVVNFASTFSLVLSLIPSTALTTTSSAMFLLGTILILMSVYLYFGSSLSPRSTRAHLSPSPSHPGLGLGARRAARTGVPTSASWQPIAKPLDLSAPLKSMPAGREPRSALLAPPSPVPDTAGTGLSSSRPVSPIGHMRASTVKKWTQ